MAVYLGSKRVDYIKTTSLKPEQEKTVEFIGEEQVVKADFGFDLKKVTIKPGNLTDSNIDVMKQLDIEEINNDGGYNLATSAEYLEAEQEFQEVASIIMFGEEIDATLPSDYYLEENIAYVKQMDMIASIDTGYKINEEDYSVQEISRLENILINLTEGV